MDKTDRLRDYGLAFLLYEHGLGVCGYELIRELFIFIKLILNSYLSNSSKLSLHLVGGYGILAIPTKSAVLLCQSGYGRDAIPSYRLPLIYTDKYERILMKINFIFFARMHDDCI